MKTLDLFRRVQNASTRVARVSWWPIIIEDNSGGGIVPDDRASLCPP